MQTPHGVRLERLIGGTGEPGTVFAHGLAGSIAATRPLGSAVLGRRVFFQFRGHGRSEAPAGPWDYADLARDLRAVADLSDATRALGVSMGAAALARLLAESPGRFERVVFFLPIPVAEPRGDALRDRIETLLATVQDGDLAAIAEAVSAELPPSVRNTPAGWGYLRQRVEQLSRDGLGADLTGLADAIPVSDPGALGAVTAEALVIGARGDDLHPVEAAEHLAGLLPRATLHVYDRPGPVFTHRADLRERIAGFLN
ncbi:pimeloyl-ACP methyl ester carboxylesterase [Catenuloplanes indicus]|uniref:Pimeloyl-ACP methyl ester carboxylesterase n=1 Tax=Catenuloplanes indicus TaxID=137267 RepID=A0AAE3W2B9_9ACTN|nr:pimeloyl-ACP methyl ester carboxylesterase [Catenuloplanes indicus]